MDHHTVPPIASTLSPTLDIRRAQFDAAEALKQPSLPLPAEFQHLQRIVQPTDNIVKAALLLPFTLQEEVAAFKHQGSTTEGTGNDDQSHRSHKKGRLKQNAKAEIEASKKEAEHAINLLCQRFTGAKLPQYHFLRLLYEDNALVCVHQQPFEQTPSHFIYTYAVGKLCWFDKRMNVLLDSPIEVWRNTKNRYHYRKAPWMFIRGKHILLITKASTQVLQTVGIPPTL